MMLSEKHKQELPVRQNNDAFKDGGLNRSSVEVPGNTAWSKGFSLFN